MQKPLKFILPIFFSVNTFSAELSEAKVKEIFVPFIESFANGDYDKFKSDFAKNSINPTITESLVSQFLKSQVIPKMPGYGQYKSSHLISNKLNDRFGEIIFLQLYENLYLTIRFSYFVKDNGNLCLKNFNIDDVNDQKELINPSFKIPENLKIQKITNKEQLP